MTTTKIYLSVPKTHLNDVMIDGITAGVNDGSLNNLPFLICDLEKPRIYIGPVAYLEIEVAPDDPKMHQTNARHCEYHDHVPVEKITAMAYPPSTIQEVLELFKKAGNSCDAPEYKARWEFHVMI